MTPDSVGLFELALLAIVYLGDALLDSTPLIIIAAGALALSIGVIAWPLNPPSKRGGGRGFV
ncbi:MAG: hypothetical protein ABFD89_18620 [Bryobacteraceae bacterium]